MKIGIDARLWDESGVGRYIRNLTINLSKIDRKNSYVLFIRSTDKEVIENEIKNKDWKFVSVGSRWHSFSEQAKFPKTIEKEKIDLMHFPYFSIPVLYRKPYVVTIHDLILHHFATGKASTLPLWAYGFKMLGYKFVINNATAHAKKIIAVSEFTKDDIIDHLRVNKRSVEMIYEGADDFKKFDKSKSETGNYFLYVGNVYPHKNAEKLLKAFESFSREKNVKLIFVGSNDYFYQRLRKSYSKLEKEGKLEFRFDASDKDLFDLYSSSIALVRPSLMEGFSLPPLEAFESGSLSLVSDIPVHKEILKDSAIYFDPKDISDIISKLEFVMKLTEPQRKEYIEKGKKRASEFSWEKAAQQTLRIYESSLSV